MVKEFFINTTGSMVMVGNRTFAPYEKVEKDSLAPENLEIAMGIVKRGGSIKLEKLEVEEIIAESVTVSDEPIGLGLEGTVKQIRDDVYTYEPPSGNEEKIEPKITEEDLKKEDKKTTKKTTKKTNTKKKEK